MITGSYCVEKYERLVRHLVPYCESVEDDVIAAIRRSMMPDGLEFYFDTSEPHRWQRCVRRWADKYPEGWEGPGPGGLRFGARSYLPKTKTKVMTGAKAVFRLNGVALKGYSDSALLPALEDQPITLSFKHNTLPRWSRCVRRWEAKHVGRPRLGQGTGIRCWCPTCGAECQITGVGRYQRVVSRCSCPPTVAS